MGTADHLMLLRLFVHVSGGLGVWMGVGCPCPPVRNNIVTLHHLFSSLLVLTHDKQGLSELAKNKIIKKVISVQNCVENLFLGVLRPYKGLLKTHPNTC